MRLKITTNRHLRSNNILPTQINNPNFIYTKDRGLGIIYNWFGGRVQKPVNSNKRCLRVNHVIAIRSTSAVARGYVILGQLYM